MTMRDEGATKHIAASARARRWSAIVMLALTVATPLQALAAAYDGPATKDPSRTANGLALTPPMGWNSWNKSGCEVNEKIVRGAVDAMVSTGMKDAGYQYVVIDDCWHGDRDKNGFITADAKRFPSGMAALADYVHSKGLKFGIYSDAGRMTCASRPGSQGHEYQDAQTYASWGVDYLKYDWCFTGTRNAEEAYALMADALRATRRDIVFSMCEWGTAEPWRWAKKIGNLWRTTLDISDKWSGDHSVLQLADQNEPLWPYAGAGHWNDPDMLEVGNGGLTAAESRSHFSLWAMMAAPLMAGNDLSAMSAETQATLTNKEVIAVDQDARAIQGHRIEQNGDQEIWIKPLAGGGRAVLLFNRGSKPARIAIDWKQLDYPANTKLNVRDLWAHRDLGMMKSRYEADVLPHDVVMLRLGN